MYQSSCLLTITTVCLFSAVIIITTCGQEVYMIKSPSSVCTNGSEKCLTLSEFAANISQYNATVTVILDSGTHVLTEDLIISSVVSFNLTSNSSYAEIMCENNSSLYFNDSQAICITKVNFSGCGGNLVDDVSNFVLEDVRFEGNDGNATALELRQSVAQIIDCVFSFNTRGAMIRIYLEGSVLPLPINSSIIFYAWVGSALTVIDTNITIKNSQFEYNRAELGGAVFLRNSRATIDETIFVKNQRTREGFSFGCHLEHSLCVDTQVTAGGALFQQDSHVSITNCKFRENSAAAGGAIFAIDGQLTVSNGSKFYENTALSYDGGAIHAWHTAIEIVESQFDGNVVKYLDGGAIYCFACSVVLYKSQFFSNAATSEGGGLYLTHSNILINGSEFINNTAYDQGGVLHIYLGRVTLIDSLIENNRARTGAAMNAIMCDVYSDGFLEIANNSEADINTSVHLIDSTLLVRGNFSFFNNSGSMMVFNSNITFDGLIVFKNNHQQEGANIRTSFQQLGGAISLFQSTVLFSEMCVFEDNIAENGGAIHSSQSKLFMKGNVIFVNNRASEHGGSMYLHQSELNCENKNVLTIRDSIAVERGGGMHAISTGIKAVASSNITFLNNLAKSGGALSLETNANLYVQKYSIFQPQSTFHFVGNTASYGGAIYVNDDTYSVACVNSDTECFFQVFALYHGQLLYSVEMLSGSFHFQQNRAHVRGSSLFGGLLNRCTTSSFVGVNNNYQGVRYFNTVSGDNSTSTSISSRPVKVCQCISDHVTCTQVNPFINVKKGQAFTVPLVAVDQIGQPVDATIQSSLTFNESGLAEGQLKRTILGECTKLTFNVISSQDSEELVLYASDGPCKEAASSVLRVKIKFRPCSCPIGFQPSGNSLVNCTCECHSDIGLYVSKCDIESQSFTRHPQSKVWISSILQENITDYLIYPNCPYDYCKLNEQVVMNLNRLDGAYAQCAFNRSLLLCGSCKSGLSLSLGSSRCLSCPRYWPMLFVVITLTAALAGIALVALLLSLNLTVAVGTLNGLIFYANIISANKSILLSFSELNFVTIIISWLNLDIGIDTCYFKGMDAYVKTWLQLAFPAYVLLLVAAVIIVSSMSSKFSNLIGKRDPVATLATLILLSYATILENTFRALTPGKLVYPNGTIEIIWLPDATIKHLSGIHIPLFITAVFILIIGLAYTVLLFSWQWLLLLPKWKIFKWIRNQRLQTFVETYSIPYTPKHRYWTGLLLLARAALCLIAATNVSNDPQLKLTSIIFIIGGIIFLKSLIGYRLYKDSFVDITETIFYFNILAFATLVWYAINKENKTHNSAIAYCSVIVALIQLVLIIIYHLNEHTTLLSRVHKTTVYQKLLKTIKSFSNLQQDTATCTAPPVDANDDDIHRFNELMDVIDGPVSPNDYQSPQSDTARSDQSTEPTCSIVAMSSSDL